MFTQNYINEYVSNLDLRSLITGDINEQSNFLQVICDKFNLVNTLQTNLTNAINLSTNFSKYTIANDELVAITKSFNLNKQTNFKLHKLHDEGPNYHRCGINLALLHIKLKDIPCNSQH